MYDMQTLHAGGIPMFRGTYLVINLSSIKVCTTPIKDSLHYSPSFNISSFNIFELMVFSKIYVFVNMFMNICQNG